jgi:hypothetical protein
LSRTQIAPANAKASAATWEEQYCTALAERDVISPEGLAEIRRCTDATFQFIGRAGDPSATPFVAGGIVGAVQCGKTGLMINLAARALDSGFRCVLVLAGLRDDLRTQTAIRFHRDLLQRGDPIPESQGGGFTHPGGIGYHGVRRDCWSPSVGDDVNHDEAFAYLLSSCLRRGDSALAVAKKNVTTLNHLRAALEFAVGQAGREPVPILVIDDECDEASVSADEDAPTPERIAEVWGGLGQRVAYVGFTATPAANLLQDPTSLLFPGDFVLTLRTPEARDTRLTYFETKADSRYTGGHTYYQLLEGMQRPNFLVNADMSRQEFGGNAGHDEMLEEALLAYFVSGAIRLVEQDLPRFDDPERLPEPHTMLAHTESTIVSHWRLCERIVHIVQSKGGGSGQPRGNIARVNPQDRVGVKELKRWLEVEPDRWKNWHEGFKRSRSVLLEVSPDRSRREMPRWEDVRTALGSVFEAVKLRVVNSDDAAVDAPLQFHPTYTAGGPQLPRDIYSIVIGGNRLSRGLTLEGLCISYYTRAALKLIEDTTVQRERWFGYRGRHLELCRVFTHRSLAIRLRRFHEHDEDLRRQLAWNIDNGRTPADATFRFLTIRDSAPTAKLGRGRGPLRLDVSGARAFVDRVQMGKSEAEQEVAARNQAHADKLSRLVHDNGHALAHEGTDLGCVLGGVSAEETATLLERFTYTFHNPDAIRGVGWTLRGFYRPHDPELPVTDYSFSPSSDPYLIAAFLRYWAAAYKECAQDPGAHHFRSADGVSDWLACEAPQFNLAIRYGSLTSAPSSPFDFPLLDREVDSDGRVGSRWGGRRGGVGDEWIDVPLPPGGPEAPRARGTPGLVLLHIIGRQATGRNGYGTEYSFDRPCMGIVVPEGGPCLEMVLAEGAK